MLALILLTFSGVLSYSVDASESECLSVLLKNLTDKNQTFIAATLRKNAQILLDEANKYASMETSCSNAKNLSNKHMDSIEAESDKPIDCAEIMKKNPLANSGVYRIWPRNRISSSSIDVYCDNEDDGGSWTVLQRRGDFGSGPDYFYRGWQSYKQGFGDLKKDFWLGNDNIFELTNQRVNVVKFVLTDWERNTAYATYDDFRIEDESGKYTLHATGYNGIAGDSLSHHIGQPFSTKDQDNDKYRGNCAASHHGAWWYQICETSSLNGFYFAKGSKPSIEGILWEAFKGAQYSLKNTVIKIRPQDFNKNRDSAQPH